MSNDFNDIVQDMQNRIRELAYLMWEAAGRQQGMALEYWTAAERELHATMGAATETMTQQVATKTPAPKKAETKPAAPAAAKAPAPKPAAPAAVKAPAPKPAAPAVAKAPAPKPAAPAAAKAPAPKPAAPAAAKTPATKPAAPAPAAKKSGYGIEQIEGIGPAYAAKLSAAGIATTDDLLDSCGGAAGRDKTAGKTGVSAKLLLKWANMADLMRISGIAGENAELLEAAGVDTVKELKTRNAENLAAKMAEVNAAKKLTRRVASASQVAKWIDQAGKLDPKITH